MMQFNVQAEALSCSGCGKWIQNEAIITEFRIKRIEVYHGGSRIRTDWNVVPTSVRCSDCDRKMKEGGRG